VTSKKTNLKGKNPLNLRFENKTAVIRWIWRHNRFFADSASPTGPEIQSFIAVPQRNETISLLEADLWATDNEILGTWIVRFAWLGLGQVARNLQTIPTQPDNSTFPSPLVKCMWGSGGVTTQVSNTVSIHNFRQWERKNAPKAQGARMATLTGGAPLAFVIFHMVTTTTGNPGIMSWADCLFETEHVQNTKKDRRKEFSGNEYWEESHDFNYAAAENY